MTHPEPVFNEIEEPVISHEHRNAARRWNRVPYPYTFKWDGGWNLVLLLLAASGFAFKPLLVVAGITNDIPPTDLHDCMSMTTGQSVGWIILTAFATITGFAICERQRPLKTTKAQKCKTTTYPVLKV